MFDTRRIQRDFSDAASQYDNYALLQQQVLSKLVDTTLPLLPPHAELLDAGCGTGRLAAQVQGHSITQLDIAYAMCVKARRQGAPAINARVEALPFGDGTFGAVFSSLALQWVPDWQGAMEEMRRVLKPGGILAISTFGPATLKELKESFAAADRYSHVSAFLPCLPDMRTETMTEYYPNLFALMRHLKNIGARNKLLGRRKSLMTPRQIKRVERRYEQCFSTASGLPVTWEILYSVIRKS